METFHLNVTGIDNIFFQGRCQQLIFTASDGEQGILAHHENAVMVVEAGEVRIQTEDGEWLVGVSGAGFVQMVNNRALMLVDTVERPEEIDVRRAQEAKERAQEQLRQKQSLREYHMNRANLARAMARLKVTSKYGNGN